MKGNSAVRMWRSFVVTAAATPSARHEPGREEDKREETTPRPALTGYTLAWDPYEVWLKRVKEPRDRREPRARLAD